MHSFIHRAILSILFVTVTFVGIAANEITDDVPFSLPLSYLPTETQFSNSIVVNANNDSKTWEYKNGYAFYSYDNFNHANDWLFIPINLTKEENQLKVTAEYRAEDKYGNENLIFAYGREANPDAMQSFLQLEGFNNTTYEIAEGYVVINEPGTAYIGIKADSEAYLYGIRVRNVCIEDFGTALPLPASIIKKSILGLEFSAVVAIPTKTVQDKDITGNVGLDIKVDGELVESRTDCHPGSEQSVKLTLAAGIHTVSFTTYLIDDGVKSEGETLALDVKAVSVDPEGLPYVYYPSQAQWDTSITEDSNSDKICWYLAEDEQAIAYNYTYIPADDWLFLPPVDFGSKGGTFDFSLEAKVASSYCPESFEICIGRTPNSADMTTALSCQDIENKSYEKYCGQFILPAGGIWYVGVHCISKAEQYTLTIRNLSISDNNADGQLTVSLSAPDTMIVGDTYTISGTVTNQSSRVLALPKMECTITDTPLEYVGSLPEIIDGGEALSFEFSFTPSADMVGTGEIKFGFIESSDDISDYETAKKDIVIYTGNKPIVLDLTAYTTDSGEVQLCWGKPSVDSSSEEIICSYHIYRNGIREISNHIGNNYLFANADNGDRFNVSVVTSKEDKEFEYPLSNTVTVARVSTGISIQNSIEYVTVMRGGIKFKGYTGSHAVILTPTGKILSYIDITADMQIHPLSKGLYLILINDSVFKVLVE